MTITERVKYLRKDVLKLTQEEFARKLNMSTSNIGSIEIGRVNLTERVIADICRRWSVNEQWLAEGTEPVFINESDTYLYKIVEIYQSLNNDFRKYLRGYIDRLLEEQYDLEQKNVPEDEPEPK
jgi:transcriptional regulator with XRE-family HTH domain